MTFAELLRVGGCDERVVYTSNGGENTPITHVCCDSRLAGPNSVFVCIHGLVTDGHIYAHSAYANGCRCFVAIDRLRMPNDCTVAYTDDTRLIMARMADIIYGHPSGELTVIGVTGTKGKTTVALTVKEILDGLGLPTGYIGSNGIIYGSFCHSSVNTTPESCDIQRYLRDMLNAGMKYAVLEVSSQALYLGRVRFIRFDTCVFTNLSPDHISSYEHPNFEHYRDSKSRLFSEFSPRYAVVNADDAHSEHMLRGCRAEVLTYGIKSPAMYEAHELTRFRTQSTLGMRFELRHGDVTAEAEIPFPGEFSVSNALAALTVCGLYADDLPQMLRILSSVTVRGRFELVPALPYATVIIDYAHNGASMTSVLEALKQYPHRKLITLFGSVGGRTEMRRTELGRAASALSDLCILTADNPDCEDPQLIAQDIVAGFVPGGCDYEIIVDRREAICHAMNLLREHDILLLAGKGHEDYQLISGVRRPFSERDIVIRQARHMQMQGQPI